MTTMTTITRGPRGFAILGVLTMLASLMTVAPTGLGHHDGADHPGDAVPIVDAGCQSSNSPWAHVREWEESARRGVENTETGIVLPALPTTVSENPVEPVRRLWDYGDAPDDANTPHARTTYTPGGSPTGSFPTLDDATSWEPMPGARHRVVDVAWLGNNDAYPVTLDESPLLAGDLPPSVERDADQLPDADGSPNLQGTSPDHDGRDDGLFPAAFPVHGSGSLQFRVSSGPGIEEWYVNVLVDWNFDGQWKGGSGGGVPEWAVQNMPVSVPPSTSRVFETPLLPVGDVPGTPWVRITLTGTPIPDSWFGPNGWDGSTPWGYHDYEGYRAFACGETEDHCGIIQVTAAAGDGTGGVRCDPDFAYTCDSHPSFAEITRLWSGQYAVHAERVKWTGETGLWLPAWAASMNGGFDAEIHYNCISGMDVELYKRYDTVDGHVNDLVYANHVDLGCGSGFHTEDVEVGLDYGEYDLVVTWVGCDGDTGVDEQRILVFDPPVFSGS